MTQKNKFTLEENSLGVLHVQTESQYELTSAFMRVQEFYESPYKSIRGKYFTHEAYMDTCAYGSSRSGVDDEVKFSYFEDWAGFNVPGRSFNAWEKLFSKDYLWDKEKELIKLVRDHPHKIGKFYVIGTSEEDANTIDHELSHAWFYLDPKYKKMMLKMTSRLSKSAHDALTANLIKDGYTKEVFEDEIIAYLSTNKMTDTMEMFPSKRIPWSLIADLQSAFEEYKEENMHDESD